MPTGYHGGRPGFTDDRGAEMIRERYARGDVTVLQLSRHLGVAQQTIRSLLRGKTYANAGGPLIDFEADRNTYTGDEIVNALLEL